MEHVNDAAYMKKAEVPRVIKGRVGRQKGGNGSMVELIYLF